MTSSSSINNIGRGLTQPIVYFDGEAKADSPPTVPIHYFTITLPTEGVVMAMVDVFHDSMIDYDNDFAIWEALTEYVFAKRIRGIEHYDHITFHEMAVQLADSFIGTVSSLDQFKLGMVTFEEELSSCIAGVIDYMGRKQLTVTRMYPTMLEGPGETLNIIVEATPNEYYVAPSLQHELPL